MPKPAKEATFEEHLFFTEDGRPVGRSGDQRIYRCCTPTRHPKVLALKFVIGPTGAIHMAGEGIASRLGTHAIEFHSGIVRASPVHHYSEIVKIVRRKELFFMTIVDFNRSLGP
ncbi:MAG TPA: hypothetical protein VLG72_08975 [Nitrospirota bacterium]|nr:hypothetical protein [Nitrospirota bacterium]